MHFEELRLLAYGPFTECTLSLRPGFNVLFGPNEAGKSSALRAIRSLLYGIAERTPDKFVHSNKQLRIGGVLVDHEGRRRECVRRKGRKATLRDGKDDQPIDEGILSQLLGGANEDFFTSVFGLDHASLREGAEDVIRGKGRVGELLFAAGGVASLREKQKVLVEAAEKLFKPTGSVPVINKLISQTKELRKEIADLQRSPVDWKTHSEAHRRYEDTVRELTVELERAEAERTRLIRIESAQGLLSSWKAKQAELAKLSGVTRLGSDVETRLADASQKQIIANEKKHHAAERITALEQQMFAVEVPEAILKHAGQIDGLYRRLGNHEKDSEDRATLEGQLRLAKSDAKLAVQRLGWSSSLAETKEHLLSDDKKARVRGLANRYGEVKQKRDQYEIACQRLRSKALQLRKSLSTETPAAPPSSLEAAISRGLASADLPRRLEKSQIEVERLRQEIAGRLARLRGWRGSLKELISAEVPGLETIDRFDEELRAAQKEKLDLHVNQAAIHKDLESVREKLNALDLADDVPTDSELRKARDTRDRGLQLVIRTLQGKVPPAQQIDEFVAEVAEGAELVESLQPSVRKADDLVDRLRREADRVAEKSQLLAQRSSFERELARVQEAQTAADETLDACQRSWTECWLASGVSPSTPAEMRGWIREQGELIELSERLRSIIKDQKLVEEQLQHAKTALLNGLSSHVPAAVEGESLAVLTETAQKLVTEMTQVIRQRTQREDELQRIEGEIIEAQSDLQTASVDLENWQTSWAEAVKALRLAPESLPEEAESVISCLEELSRSLTSSEGFEKRIWGINKTAEEFGDEVRELADRVAPGLVDQSVENTANALHQQLSEARESANYRTGLEQQRAAEKESLAEAERAFAEAAAIVDSLVEQAGCATLDHLPDAIEKSMQKQQLSERVEELSSQLSRFCGGKLLEDFAEEVAAEDADRLPVQIEELGHTINRVRSQRDEAIEGKQREASKLDLYQGASAAADRANERQFLLSKIETDARNYAVTMVASRLLTKAIEQYQEKTQGPVLSMASKHFATLTCGAFQGLKADLDESGEEILVGARSDGSSLLVEEMSEGTRDQVYFALRLGTIDHWLDRNNPIPFVIDDVLLAFDDERAEAALRTLADLSSRTQVLFFTHHEHLISLARKATEGQQPNQHLHVLDSWQR